MLRGAQAEIDRAQTRRLDLVPRYEFLLRLYHDLHRFAIQSYSPEADRVYSAMAPAIKRHGSNDCRIAAIAIAHGCIVVTANTRHFEKIPGLTIEDWTR